LPKQLHRRIFVWHDFIVRCLPTWTSVVVQPPKPMMLLRLRLRLPLSDLRLPPRRDFSVLRLQQQDDKRGTSPTPTDSVSAGESPLHLPATASSQLVCRQTSKIVLRLYRDCRSNYTTEYSWLTMRLYRVQCSFHPTCLPTSTSVVVMRPQPMLLLLRRCSRLCDDVVACSFRSTALYYGLQTRNVTSPWRRHYGDAHQQRLWNSYSGFVPVTGHFRRTSACRARYWFTISVRPSVCLSVRL